MVTTGYDIRRHLLAFHRPLFLRTDYMDSPMEATSMTDGIDRATAWLRSYEDPRQGRLRAAARLFDGMTSTAEDGGHRIDGTVADQARCTAFWQSCATFGRFCPLGSST